MLWNLGKWWEIPGPGWDEARILVPALWRGGPFCFQPGSGCLQSVRAGFPGLLTLPGGLRSWVFLLAVPGVCGCCGALRPRYKRLVDNIFPEDPEVGHVSSWHRASIDSSPPQALGAAVGGLKAEGVGISLRSGSAEGSGSSSCHAFGHCCMTEMSFPLMSLWVTVP